MVGQKVTHFTCAQNFKSVSLFGLSIFRKFFGPKIDILEFREHLDINVFLKLNLKLEHCIRSMANIFCNLDVRSVNHGFKKTGLSKFQSEPVIETQLTREEDIMNLI